MIPKIIHYCWFGRNPLPPLALKCIESWKKYLPEYEIKEWNEDNFDVNIIPYTQEAYQAKKYAFVSDYARFWILYHYGGLYFDTDVEVIKPMDDIISRGAFMGCQNAVENSPEGLLEVAPGLGIGANSGLGIYKDLLDLYETLRFIMPNGSYNQVTVVSYTTQILSKYGLKNIPEIQKCDEIWIYPKDYFCPITYTTGECQITKNTYSIHHYSASWYSNGQKLYRYLKKFVSPAVLHWISGKLKDWHLAK